MIQGKVTKVSGSLVVADGMLEAGLFDAVRIGSMKLTGEIIEIKGGKAYIRVCGETAGISCGDEVESAGVPLSVELGPGLISNVYDGIFRPLEVMHKNFGANIIKGIDVPTLDRAKKWAFTPRADVGIEVTGGDIIGTVAETELVEHKIMIPPNVSGRIDYIAEAGSYTVGEVIAKVDGTDITMVQKWAVRKSRPYAEKLTPAEPMITGQRIIDSFFPIVKGGTACITGSSGSGKTVIQHQLAKWSGVDIVIYIGCGERGNEMADIIRELRELKDPESGHPLMKRTVLIANTSDMPVAAREVAIYTGITTAEYFRDMGYSVAVIADSVSRWAEAMRETSGEEGYPANLYSKLAQFYDRAGKVVCIGSEERTASITAVGAVSGDVSDPVVQAALRLVRVFWKLDENLAYARHFPSIDPVNSYSLYKDRLGDEWVALMNDALKILRAESELPIRSAGADALSSGDGLIIEAARSVREDYLFQDSFSKTDFYSSVQKQFRLMKIIVHFFEKAEKAVESGADIEKILNLPVREAIARAKDIPEADVKAQFDAIRRRIDEEFSALSPEGEN